MTVASAVLAVLLALVFIGAGGAKVLALEPMRERAAEVGFSTSAYRRIGLLEVAGAIGLLLGWAVPLIGGLAGIGLLLLLGGAVVTHVRAGDSPKKLAPAVVCGVLVAAYLVALVAITS
jgi:hypothetical protein